LFDLHSPTWIIWGSRHKTFADMLAWHYVLFNGEKLAAHPAVVCVTDIVILADLIVALE
jgi:hypothetical protein